MATQTAKPSPERPTRKDEPKKGIKNPVIYAGAVVLTVFVIVAFVFVPSGSVFEGGSTLEFGRWNGKPITYAPGNYLANQVQDINDTLRSQGLSEESFQFFAYQVWRGAFERSVVREAVLSSVRDAGGLVTAAWLDERMAELPEFSENGKFSTRKWREASAQRKAELRSSLRDDMLAQYYYQDLFAQAPSSKEVEFVKAMAKETRSVEYVVFPLSSYPDAEVLAWTKDNTALFRKAKLSRITLGADEKEAKDLIGRIQSDAVSFVEAAKANSKDSWADQGGDLGYRFFNDLVADLEKKEDAEAVFALEKGKLSAPLKTSGGSWAFFRMEESVLQADLADPGILAAARSYMERSERGKIEDWTMAKAKDFAAGAAGDFPKAAKAAGLEISSVGPFPLNYGDLSITAYGQTAPLFRSLNDGTKSELATASTNERFLTQVFSLAPGALSEPVLLKEEVMVLRVKEVGSALDEDLSSISLYYPFLFQQRLEGDLRDVFMKSPKLKDNFMDTYFKYFSPKQS